MYSIPTNEAAAFCSTLELSLLLFQSGKGGPCRQGCDFLHGVVNSGKFSVIFRESDSILNQSVIHSVICVCCIWLKMILFRFVLRRSLEIWL